MKRLVSKETVVLCKWRHEAQKFGIKQVDIRIQLPLLIEKITKLTF